MPGSRITCPHCHRTLKLKPGKELSKNARCPSCEQLLRKPAPATAAPNGSPQMVQNVLLGAIAVGLFVIGGSLVFSRSSSNESVTPTNQEIAAADPTPAAADKASPLPSPTRKLSTAVEIPTSNSASSTMDSAVESKELRVTAPSAPPFEPRFRFLQKADTFRFSFAMKAKLDRSMDDVNGLVILRELANKGTHIAMQLGEESSGTAFGVRSDGYMLTCAHVVEDAYEIEVTLADQTFPARVVRVDEDNDLAILKLDVENMPTIPLDVANPAKLGQDIRAIGYPLSDLLGQDVKVTRGTITGGIGNAEDPRLQIDATINPGNSGGPIVDSYGNVVGVASAKLAGIFLSDVGLCVPTQTAAKLLSSAGIDIPPASQSEGELAGPVLVERVARAVGYVSVKSGPDPNEDNMLMEYSFSPFQYTEYGRPKDIPHLLTGKAITNERDSHFLRTECGELYERPNAPQFPYLAGEPLDLLYFESPPVGQDEWKVESDTLVFRLTTPRSSLGFRKAEFAATEAKQTTTYKILQDDDNEVVIERTHTLKSVGNEEQYHLESKGKLVFNKEEQAISSVNLTGSLKYQIPDSQRTIPFTLTGEIFRTTDESRKLEKMSPGNSAPKAEPPELANYTKKPITVASWAFEHLALHPTQPFIFAGTNNDRIEVYNHQTREQVDGLELPSENSSLTALALSPDGSTLLAGMMDGKILIFNVGGDGKLTAGKSFHGHSRTIRYITISPNGQNVLSSADSKKVRFWNLKTQKENFVTPEFKGFRILPHFIDDKTAWLCTGIHLQKWDLSKGEGGGLVQLDRAATIPKFLRFSPTGDEVLVPSGRTLKRWATDTGEQLPDIQADTSIHIADFAGDNIVTGNTGRISFWTPKGDLIGSLLMKEDFHSVQSLVCNQKDGSVSCAPSSAPGGLWSMQKKN